MKNKPLTVYKKKKLIASFCEELTATQAAHRLHLDRNTVNKYYKRIREAIAAYREYQKMRLLINVMSIPDHKPEVVSRQFPSANASEGKIPVQLMYLSGQLVTELNGQQLSGVMPRMNVGEYFNTYHEPITEPPGFAMNGSLAEKADDFHMFATERFKKYFGIRNEFAYLYLKEAEFVYNDQDPARREKLLNRLIEQIFG